MSGTQMDVLLPSGWHRCGGGLRRLLDRERQRSLSEDQCERRRRRAGNRIPADAPTVASPPLRVRMRLRPIAWRLSPPLGYGGAQFASAARDARRAFVERLGPHVTTELLDDAREGLEGARARRSRIEQRAQSLASAAGLTGTLVLANGALVVGQDPAISRYARTVVVIALSVAFVAIAATLVYAVLAVTRTFGTMNARGTLRILERSHLEAEAARRAAVGALLAAQFRTGHVADWKLARFKRARAAFFVALASLTAAGGPLLVNALP